MEAEPPTMESLLLDRPVEPPGTQVGVPIADVAQETLATDAANAHEVILRLLHGGGGEVGVEVQRPQQRGEWRGRPVAAPAPGRRSRHATTLSGQNSSRPTM